MIRYIASVVFGCVLTASAQAQDLDAATSAKLESAIRIGKEIQAQDLSAWHVTDALMAVRLDATGKQILYVTERLDATHLETTFVQIEGEKIFKFFSGVTVGADVVSTQDFTRDQSPPLATDAQVARADALLTAREMFQQGLCGERPNYVVLPSEVAGALDVYGLAPETETDVIQIGGHVRITIDANGLVIPSATKAYSKSCLSVEQTGKTEAIFVTLPASIGDTPTEMHVFKSISHNIPIYVGTSTGTWEVSGARIRLVDATKPPN